MSDKYDIKPFLNKFIGDCIQVRMYIVLTMDCTYYVHWSESDLTFIYIHENAYSNHENALLFNAYDYTLDVKNHHLDLW